VEKPSTELAVRRFLNEGFADGITEDALAQGCDALILQTARKSLPQAMILARKYAAAVRSRSGPLALSAYRALARITHMSGAHADASIALWSMSTCMWGMPHKPGGRLTGRFVPSLK
jgi:hypothetical protein